MSLRQQLDDDIKTALLAGDKLRTETLRGLKTAIAYADVAARARDTGGVPDDQVLSLFAKEAKKRQESADLYVRGGSQERADKELAEKKIIEAYLPAQLSDEELLKLIDEAIAASDIQGPAATGKVIGAVKAQAGTSADGAKIAGFVRGAARVILLMGVAGSGKSTQGRQLADEYGYAYLSTGDIFRVLITGRRRAEMLEGRLLSDDEVIKITDTVLRAIDTKEQFILDGFPRTKTQVDWLLTQIAAGRFDVPVVVNLEVDEAAIRERLGRRGRIDDNEAAVSRRYGDYQTTTRPLLDYMREQGWTVHTVDAGHAPQVVYKDVVAALKLEQS